MNERDARYAAALARHAAAMSNLKGRYDQFHDANPANASLLLDYIRSLQELADLLDEVPPSETVDSESTQAVVHALASAILVQAALFAEAKGLGRPFRHVLSLVFSNDMVRELKEQASAPGPRDYDDYDA